MLEPRALLIRECFAAFGERPFTVGELVMLAGLRPALATVIRAAIPALAAEPKIGVVHDWFDEVKDQPILVNCEIPIEPRLRPDRPLTISERQKRFRLRRKAEKFAALPSAYYLITKIDRWSWAIVSKERVAAWPNERAQELETA